MYKNLARDKKIVKKQKPNRSSNRIPNIFNSGIRNRNQSLQIITHPLLTGIILELL